MLSPPFRTAPAARRSSWPPSTAGWRDARGGRRYLCLCPSLHLDLADALDHVGQPGGIRVEPRLELVGVLIRGGHLHLLERGLERGILDGASRAVAEDLHDGGRRRLRREESDPEGVFHVV